MRSSNELPDKITPQFFFEELLPEWADELFSPPIAIEEVVFSVVVDIVGAKGTPWTLTFDLGDYSVRSGWDKKAQLFIRSDQKNWDKTATSWIKDLLTEIEKAGSLEEFVDKWQEYERQKQGKNFRMTERKWEALSAHPALFQVSVQEKDGHPMNSLVGLFHSDLEGTPDFKLMADWETVEKIRHGQLLPFDAWTQKKISLEGNLTLALNISKILLKEL